MFESLDGLHSALSDFTHISDAFSTPHGAQDPHEAPQTNMADLGYFSPWADDGHIQDMRSFSIGDPHGDGFTPQTTSFTCAVTSQKMVLDQFGIVDAGTGAPLSEAQLVYDATVHGWLGEHGTSIDDMGQLLEYHGVPVHHGVGLDHMFSELAQGHQVIAAVNANELSSPNWQSLDILDKLIGAQPNHALVFKGVRLDEQGHMIAVLNDPGQPHGAGVECPIDQFRAALDDSGFHYVATDTSPPGWSAPNSPGLENHLASTSTNDPVQIHPTESFADYVTALSTTERNDFLKRI